MCGTCVFWHLAFNPCILSGREGFNVTGESFDQRLKSSLFCLIPYYMRYCSSSALSVLSFSLVYGHGVRARCEICALHFISCAPKQSSNTACSQFMEKQKAATTSLGFCCSFICDQRLLFFQQFIRVL